MSLLKKLKVLIRTLQDRLKLRFYSRKNIFEASYKVQIKNNEETEQKCYLIAPIPSCAEYQKIENIQITPEPKVKDEDKTHKNKYAIWEFSLPGKEKKTFEIKFKATVKPRTRTQRSEVRLSEKYLSPNKYIHSDNKEIKELAHKIVGSEKDPKKIINMLNEYVISELKYGKPIEGLYTSDAALKNDCVDCGGYNTFLIALLRAVEIPARNISGFWTGYKTIKHRMHAWMEAQLPDGKWLPLDPSSEQLFRQGRIWTSGRLGFTGSDRIEMSHGEDITLENGLKTDILQNPILICEDKASDIALEFEFEMS